MDEIQLYRWFTISMILAYSVRRIPIIGWWSWQRSSLTSDNFQSQSHIFPISKPLLLERMRSDTRELVSLKLVDKTVMKLNIFNNNFLLKQKYLQSNHLSQLSGFLIGSNFNKISFDRTLPNLKRVSVQYQNWW